MKTKNDLSLITKQLDKEVDIFKHVMHLAQEGIVIIDKAEVIIFANDYFCNMLGVESIDILGQSLRILQDAENAAHMEQCIKNRRAGISEAHSFVFTHISGRKVYTMINTTPLLDDDGKYNGAIATIHDITQEHLVMGRLKREELRFRELKEFTRTYYWELDSNAYFSYISSNVTEILGYSTEEIIGKLHFYDLLPKKDSSRVKKTGLDIFRSKGIYQNMDHVIETKFGYQIWVRTNGTPIYDEQEKFKGYQGTDQDISEIRLAYCQIEESLTQMRQLHSYELRARESERASIARFMHDEFGQTMTALKYELSQIQKKCSDRDGVLAKQAARMREMMAECIHQVQDLSQELRPALIDTLGLNAAINYYCERFEQRVGIRCNLVIEGTGINHPELELNLYRILQEALTNVARHSKATAVCVKLVYNLNQLDMQIKDNGIGLKPEQISGKHSYGIMSLKERVKAFDGSIHFRLNGGTQMDVTIPLLGISDSV